MPSLLSRGGLSATHPNAMAATKNFTIPLSFILPIFMLYLLHPHSFQMTWKGRAPYLFFLCLYAPELFIAWKKLPQKISNSLTYKKILAVAATMAAPTAYVITVFVFGISQGILEIGNFLGAGRYGEWFLKDSWPLSFEYLLLTALFAASIYLMYGIKGLKRFSASLFFLGATGFFYMIDTFYPYGTITTLQSFVPSTASSATRILERMGYATLLLPGPGGAVHLNIGGPTGGAHWYLYWPSAGIHSFLIYTLVIFLFIRDAPFSPQPKTVYTSIPKALKSMAKSKSISSLLEHKRCHMAIMAAETFFVNVLRMMPLYIIVFIGAVGAFMANVLRIVYICTIGSKIGPNAGELFHSYQGELYFVAWVIAYLMILLLLIRIWTRPAETG